MKHIVLLAYSTLTLMGTEGYQVYQKHCMKCHAEMMTKEEVLANLNTLKAPPMIEVSNRLKENIIIADDDKEVKRRVVIVFIKDYIDHPSIQYSMCHPIALEKFGIMPSLKGKLKEKEKQAIAEWVYDRYEGKKFE